MILVYFIPLGALLMVAHWAAIKARDWFSLTFLGAFWGSWMYWGGRWWPEDPHHRTVAVAELWRQVQLDARYWIPSLVLAGGFYVWRASRPHWRAAGLRLRLMDHLVALVGLAGFPLLLPSARAMIAEQWEGGAAMAVLYPSVVLSFALFGAAFRSPKTVTAVSLRAAMVVVGFAVLVTVFSVSQGILVPDDHDESFWSSHIWMLFGTDQLGVPFAGLALVWIVLAMLARRDGGASAPRPTRLDSPQAPMDT
jgi:hypothetical protein